VANLLRKQKTPVLLAVNKIDDPKDELNAMEFYKLGLGEPFTLSAMRGSGGVGDLLDKIVELLPKLPPKDEKSEYDLFNEEADIKEDVSKLPFSIGIVGKPNVGKSSVTNVLCGTSRSIVSPVPGTTRDAIDTPIKLHGRELTLIDTAGIRRKSKVDYGIEAFSVVRSIQAINRADVVVLMLDASEEITDQDQKIGAKIEEAGKACVVVMNKWDLIEEKSSALMKEYVEQVRQQLRHLSYAEVVFTSALTKQRVTKIIEACERAFAQSRKRVTTGLLNQVLNEAVALVPPPSSKRGKRARLYYSTQVAVAPPAFVLFVNDAKLLTPSYYVYLERKLREGFGFDGVPLRLMARSKER
jgi:GTP-binding protein